MKIRSNSALLVAVIGFSLALTACASQQVLPEPEETTAPPLNDTTAFRIAEFGEGDQILIAPSAAEVGGEELTGKVALVGKCLGVKTDAKQNVTVVWPAKSVSLTKKLAVEFPVDTVEGPSLARFNVGDTAILDGNFINESSWFDQVPGNCPLTNGTVFVVNTGSHPVVEKPETEQE